MSNQATKSNSDKQHETQIDPMEIMKQLKEFADHLAEYESRYKAKCNQNKDLKIWGDSLIVQNEELISTVEYLCDKIEDIGNNPPADTSQDELILIMTQVFKRNLDKFKNEYKMALDLLQRFDTKIDQALHVAGTKSCNGASESTIYVELKDELAKIRTRMGARLQSEGSTPESTKLGKWFTNHGLAKSAEKEDNDTKMDT